MTAVLYFASSPLDIGRQVKSERRSMPLMEGLESSLGKPSLAGIAGMCADLVATKVPESEYENRSS